MIFRKNNSVDYEAMEMTFQALVPIPEAQKKLIEKFVGQATPKSKKAVGSFYMSHGKQGDSDFAKAWGSKAALLNSWHISVAQEGGETETYKIRGAASKAVKNAAQRLADTVTDVKQRFDRARTVSLKEADVVKFRFGDNKDTYEGEGEASSDKVDGETMMVSASIPMPEVFFKIFDRMRDMVTPEARKNPTSFTIGIHENEEDSAPGVVVVTRTGQKEWQATGHGGSEYSKSFEKMTQEQVIDKIAFDLAAQNVSDDAIIAHICKHSLKPEQILEIETARYTYDQSDLEAEALEQG